jgi:hypothetical protein
LISVDTSSSGMFARIKIVIGYPSLMGNYI